VTDDDAESLLVLSPFVVTADEDEGYAARSTLAGTRIRTDLKDVGSSISVITKQFLEDTNSTNIESLLVYTANTEVSGEGGNFLGKGDGAILTSPPGTSTRVRGLTSADNTRDYYLTDVPFDSYNTGRVDIQRGPNAILFGIGSPSGIINASINTAAFKDSNRASVQFGSFGTERYTADFNKVILKDELALRLSYLDERRNYRQNPAYRDDRRIFAAAKYEPQFLKRGSARTTLRVNFEKGDIDSNVPRTTPPIDTLTQWFAEMNKITLNPITVSSSVTGGPFFQGYAGNSSNYTQVAYDMYGNQLHQTWHNRGANAGRWTIAGVSSYSERASRAGVAGGFIWETIGGYKAKSMTDRSVFDFYEHMLEGPNKFEFNRFKTHNVTLEQTFLNEKIGFELAYDKQEARSGRMQIFSDSTYSIIPDMLEFLPYSTTANPIPNPNLGKAMFVSSGGDARWQQRNRENLRATAFAELNFNELLNRDSWVAKIFGRNTFTGLVTRQTLDDTTARYGNQWVAPGFAADPAYNNPAYSGHIYQFVYLTDDMRSRSSASGLNIQGLQGLLRPQGGSIKAFNNVTRTLDTIPFTVQQNNDVPDELKVYGDNSTRTWEQVDSKVAVWQGYWFGGTIIPMVGWRQDIQKFANAGVPKEIAIPNVRSASRSFDIYSPDWYAPEGASDTRPGTSFKEVEVQSRTYSVVTHLPQRLRGKLPGNLDVSLIYNQSANVKPDAGRRDIYGGLIPNPEGTTKEYGVAIFAFDEKLSLKIAKYETIVKNATLSGNITSTQKEIARMEAQGQAIAKIQRDHAGDPRFAQAVPVFGTATNGFKVTWQPDGPLKGDEATGFLYSQAEIDATGAKQQTSLNAWFSNPLNPLAVSAWSLLDYDAAVPPFDGAEARYDFTTGTAVTGDTSSEGYELEMIASPARGLNIALNVSKTTATRTNLAESFAKHLEERWAFFQGPAGDVRVWGGSAADRADPATGRDHGGSGETVRGKLKREVMNGYFLYRALEGAHTPELRPWSASVTANYAFQTGALKGWRVGGSYRWAAPNVIGFLGQTIDGVDSYDVENGVKGPAQRQFDLSLSYERKLGKKLRWRVQVNARNVFADDSLIPVTIQADGGPAGYRIPEPRTFALTNTFDF
jgi:outer membrane receptor protein involved in Fe transport